MSNLWTRSLMIGVAGAASVYVIDSLLGRMPSLNARPVVRPAARIAIAGAGAMVAEKLRAPEPVVDGVLAGAVMVSALDLAVSLIGRKRTELPPPAPVSAEAAGQPWAPRPLYVT